MGMLYVALLPEGDRAFCGICRLCPLTLLGVQGRCIQEPGFATEWQGWP